MMRSLIVLIIIAVMLAACAPAAPAPTQPIAPAQPTQAPAAPAPTTEITIAPPELRPPASGGQLNPPTSTPATNTTSRSTTNAQAWQLYRDSVLGLSFYYPPDWTQSVTTSVPSAQRVLRRIQIAHFNQAAGNNASILIDVYQRQGDLLAWTRRELPAGSLMIAAEVVENGFTSIRNYNARLAGGPAIFVYTPEHGSGTTAMAALFAVDGRYFYQFTYRGDHPDSLANRAVYLELLSTVTLTQTTTPGLTLSTTSFRTGVVTTTITP